MLKTAVLVSGGGTNLQALIDARDAAKLPHCDLALVLASKPDVYALTRAARAGIKAATVDRKAYGSADDFCAAILNILQEHNIKLIVLAGFLHILNKRFIDAYRDRILNVHPSLIPSFCGDGFYGLCVHKAALDYGVKVTGATVHFVNEITDGGEIILQKAVEVQAGDTAETLQRRVMEEAEWLILPQAAEMVCERIENGELEWQGMYKR